MQKRAYSSIYIGWSEFQLLTFWFVRGFFTCAQLKIPLCWNIGWSVTRFNQVGNLYKDVMNSKGSPKFLCQCLDRDRLTDSNTRAHAHTQTYTHTRKRAHTHTHTRTHTHRHLGTRTNSTYKHGNASKPLQRGTRTQLLELTLSDPEPLTINTLSCPSYLTIICSMAYTRHNIIPFMFL